MGSEHVNPIGSGGEPELHLLITDKQFEEPLYKSLFRELDEFFFPKKLPPLKLESKPEPVRDIWGFYDYKKNGALGSTGVHVLIVARGGRRRADRTSHRESRAATGEGYGDTGGPGRHSGVKTLQDTGRGWWRWWRSRRPAGEQGQVAEAVDATDHSARGGCKE